jgi:4-hydroxy-tetrahydrodipicolinate synthase
MNPLKGVIAAAATPLRKDFSIDHERLIEHCRFLLTEGGCDGINLLGTTGEATSFSLEQRLSAMRAVARSGLPLERFMVGTGAAALEDACRLAAAAKEMGFAGALMLPPFYYKGIDQKGLIAFVSTVIERVGRQDFRLYLYHFPANAGVPYAPETVRRLRDTYPEVLKGLKDSSGDVSYTASLVRTLPGFDVFPGSETILAEVEAAGAAGCISATANVNGLFLQMALTGASPELRTAALNDAIRIRAAMSGFVLAAAVKEALAWLHRMPEWRRLVPPLVALAPGDRDRLLAALEATPLGTKERV